MQKNEQIIQMVEQCFAIQNTYGKTSQQLEILMMAMVEDLESYSLDEIQNAFLQWRRSESIVPTPADIINTIKSARIKERRKNGYQGM